MPGPLFLLVFGVVSGAIYAFGAAVAARLLGCPVYEVSLFFGPALMRRRIVGLPLTLRLIPFGGSVRLEPCASGESWTAENAEKSFREMAPIAQLAVLLSGVGALGLASAALMGPMRAGQSVIHGFAEVLTGALFPLSIGRSLVAQAFEIGESNFTLGLGILFAKAASVNLLPLPYLDGFRALVVLASALEPPRDRFVNGIQCVGTVVLVAFLLSWLVAVTTALAGG